MADSQDDLSHVAQRGSRIGWPLSRKPGFVERPQSYCQQVRGFFGDPKVPDSRYNLSGQKPGGGLAEQGGQIPVQR